MTAIYAVIAILIVAVIAKTVTAEKNSSQTVNLAVAIAIAEGTLNPDGTANLGSAGYRSNNPGDILDANGGLVAYATIQDGWNALYAQVNLMLTGKSAYYRPGMSLIQVAGVYTGGDSPQGWAQAVAQRLGVSITTTLDEIGSIVT